jgi:hypothetical protein
MPDVPAPSGTRRVGQSSKIIWNWLQFLLVPAVLVAGGYWFTQEQHQQATSSQTAHSAADRAIAADQAQEMLLNTYIDRISDLLLPANPGQRPLGQSQPGDTVRAVARARTLNALVRLDGTRKGQLLQFLSEVHLITGTISLAGAALSEATLSGVDLSGADLSGADLSGANLSQANMYGANLSSANLGDADLTEGDLRRANLSHADLGEAALIDANLRTAVGITDGQVERETPWLSGTILPSGTKHR